MKKRWISICMAGSLLLLQGQMVQAARLPGQPAAASTETESIFEKLPEEFWFSSGAGAWGTGITLADDGSFEGQFHDSNMGETGAGYPNGSVYYCNFSGKFTEPEKIDDLTYSMKLEYLNMEDAPGVEFIQDGVRYIASEAYGMDNADEFMIYMPGTQKADVPEDFWGWVHMYVSGNNFLPANYYGIYNVGGKSGFVGVSDEPTETAPAETGDYIFPDVNARYLTMADIEQMSVDEIQRAVNEIYARHGRVFTMAENDAYFRSKSWYYPIEGKTDDQILAEFNAYEKANMEFMAQFLN